MSDYEHHRGRMVEVKSSATTSLNNICNAIANERGLEWTDYYEKYHKDDWITFICDKLDREYVYINERLYKVDDTEIDPSDDIIIAERQSDGSITFELRFYNGACCFIEGLSEAVDKLEGDEKSSLKKNLRRD